MAKILVIDDEPNVRTLIDALLSRQGAHIMGLRMSQRPTVPWNGPALYATGKRRDGRIKKDKRDLAGGEGVL